MTAPWLPPRVEGFGPWIEGNKLPDDVKGDVRVHILLESERRKERFLEQAFSAGFIRNSAFIGRVVKFVSYAIKET